ncbi:MAG: TonB-dependent receptor [Cyclobacteriaceae bacterium]|nr:TonB-dependent receptor [Cyclobacteriaceae bacterium]
MRFLVSFLSGCAFLLLSQQLYAQTYTVTGTVSDKNEVLIGASIIELVNKSGTITDHQGRFSLDVSAGAKIRISYIGYLSQEFTITESAALTVVLEEDDKLLNEVVVIGYGTVKKSDLTGSVASIKAEDFINTSISSIDQGIQGKAAGVVVSMSSGQPGAPSSVRIRGNSSITAGNEPLYVIDGVLIVLEAIGYGTGPSLNPLANINPSDIESIEILKDASATAIYGTRGSNGVIIVTTKRGKQGAPVFNVSYTQSLQQLRKKIPMLNAAQLAILGNEATDNAGAPRRLIYASPVNLGVGTDWQDQIFQLAPMANFQVSARGGKEGSTYAISANYFDQEGIIKNSGFTKGNIRINLDQRISKVNIGTSLNITRSSLQGVVTDSESAIPSSVTSWALAFNPGLNVYDNNGDYVFENNTSQPAVGNPVADINNTKQVTNSTRLLGNVFVTWDFLDAFQFKTSIGTDAVFNASKSFVPNNIKRGEGINGQAALANHEGINWLFENTLSYKKDVGHHHFNAVIGHSMQAYRGEALFVATSDFDDNRLGYNAIQAGKKRTLLVNDVDAWQLMSFLGRLNYNLKEKYLFTVSARIDGSSKFGVGNKYGTFPSFAFAWRMKEESFLADVNTISDLKLRIGYGVVGNQSIPSYKSMGLLETTEAYFGENEIAKGSGPGSFQNDKLKWETTSQFDVGVDLGLLNGRVTLVTDVYYKKTTDLLLLTPVPYTSGYRDAYFNIGSMENKGVELAVSTVNTVKAVKWNSSFNIAFNRNKVLDLNSDQPIIPDPMLGITRWTEVNAGVALGTFYGYKTNGIIQLNEDPATVPRFIDYAPQHGDRKYVDRDTNGSLDEKDKFVLGNANPDFTFGLNNTITYKALSLSIFIQGVYGNEIVNFNKFSLESFDGNQNNSTAALKRWTPENPSNIYPRANVSPRVNTLSDHQVEDGSYLRVRDITLSYDLGSFFMNKLKVPFKNCMFFVSAKNLITLTNYSGYDPEVNRFFASPLMHGADYGTYPTTKIYSTGLNITF